MSMTTELAQRMKAEISALDDTQWYLAKPSEIRSLVEALEAALMRNAELEARTVKLPKPISVLHRRDFNDAHRAIYAYPEAEVNAALAVAGIQVIEGEG